MKSKLILTVSILLAFGFILVACDNGNLTDNYDPTRPIVCFGDSQTAGFINGPNWETSPGLQDGKDEPEKSYPAHLQKKVTVRVINAGLSRDTASTAKSRIDSHVLSENPQIVIIALGGNDVKNNVPTLVANPESALSLAGQILGKLQTDLQTIIDSLKNENRKLYLAKFYTKEMIIDLANREGLDQKWQDPLYTSLDGMYTRLAASNNIELIDALDGVYNEHMSDPIHPDEEGYEIMAENYFNAMSPYLAAHNLIK
jgi:acyl-CoA thioesterase-1